MARKERNTLVPRSPVDVEPLLTQAQLWPRLPEGQCGAGNAPAGSQEPGAGAQPEPSHFGAVGAQQVTPFWAWVSAR